MECYVSRVGSGQSGPPQSRLQTSGGGTGHEERRDGAQVARWRCRVKAAIYLRVSTEEQAERGTIETQREFAKRYCSMNSILIHDFYADDGVSGTIPLGGRPEGARLLADAWA